MDFAFPEDLARQITKRWQSFAARRNSAPPLPAPAILRHILSTAFFASLERVEGRPLRFVLCCSPDLDVVRDGFGETVPVVPLAVPRPISIEAIRALAPAVSPTNGSILVRFPRDPHQSASEIAGVLHVGEHVARARSGRSFYYRPAPFALTIEVCDPGELHVYQGGAKVVSLKAGHLHDLIAYSELEFLPISQILMEGERALRSRIVGPAHEPARETSDFEWTALLNTVLCIVNTVRASGHGGTVLLTAPGAETSLPVQTKFSVAEHQSMLGERFIEFLNARHVLTGARLFQRRQDPAGAALDTAHSHLQNAAFAAEESLADAAELIAGLTAVDGALILTSDLRIPGFGAEIVLDTAKPVVAHEVIDRPQSPAAWPAVDSESFGMRHRSALRCVGVTDQTAAFVISQDGHVSLFWKQDGRILLKRHVSTANPNMIGRSHLQ
jgi:Probable sensor domain DACNV